MDDTVILGHLEALADTLGIQIRYESMEGDAGFSTGGLCRVRNKQYIIVNARATMREKVNTLSGSLRRFDLSHIYIRPALRYLLAPADEE